MSQIKVVFVVHSYDAGYIGGVLKVVSMLANSLVNSGFSVEILSLGAVKTPAFHLDRRVLLKELCLEYYDTRQLKGLKKLWWFIHSYRAIRDYLRKNNEKKVLVTSSPPLSILFALFNRRRYRVIGCDHTSTIYRMPVGLQSLRNRLLSRLSCMIALTPEDQQYYETQGIQSVHIPNPVIAENRKRAPGAKEVVFIGRFSAEKDPLEALKIFHKSELWKIDYLFKMYGYGEQKSLLEHYILRHDLTEVVQLIEGETDPAIMLKNAKCLLLTSSIEGFGLVLLESMSWGVPTIAYDCDFGPRNIIKEGVNGYLIPMGDQASFVSKLKELVRVNPFDPESVSASIDEFYLENITNKWEKVLKSVWSVKL